MTAPTYREPEVEKRLQLAKSMVGKVVEFTTGVEELEEYMEPQMRAIVTAVTTGQFHQEDDTLNEAVFKITFSFESFDQYNRRFESATYYDKNRRPCLTAREAGFYHPTRPVNVSAQQVGEAFVLAHVDPLAKALTAFFEVVDGGDVVLDPKLAAVVSSLRDSYVNTDAPPPKQLTKSVGPSTTDTPSSTL